MTETVDLNLESVRQFLLNKGGRATQEEVTNHFKDLTSKDDSVKAQARRQFKEISNLITCTKEEEGVKYIHLSKNGQSEVTYRRRQRPLSPRTGKCNSYTEHQQEHLLLPFGSKEAYKRHSCEIDQRNNSTSNVHSVTESPSQGRRKLAGTRPKSTLTLVKNSYQKQLLGSVEALETDDDYFGHDHDEIHPEEKEWMFACSSGQLDKQKELLADHPYLLDNKDFVLGYTALHWAAKLGRTDIVSFVAEKNTTIDAKSHGGYTPLHVAAMSGKDDVISKLIELGASLHSRDNNGKKPKDVVKETVSPLVQNKLGRSLILDTKTVLLSGLAVTRVKKSRFSRAFGSDGEVSPLGSPANRRRIKSFAIPEQKGKKEILMPSSQSFFP